MTVLLRTLQPFGCFGAARASWGTIVHDQRGPSTPSWRWRRWNSSDESVPLDKDASPVDKAREAYKILGLPPGASTRQIQERFRGNCKLYHPDLHRHVENFDRTPFLRVQWANDELRQLDSSGLKAVIDQQLNAEVALAFARTADQIRVAYDQRQKYEEAIKIRDEKAWAERMKNLKATQKAKVSEKPKQTTPTQAKPTQAKPTQAKPTQAKSTQAKPTQAKPTPAKPRTAGAPGSKAAQKDAARQDVSTHKTKSQRTDATGTTQSAADTKTAGTESPEKQHANKPGSVRNGDSDEHTPVESVGSQTASKEQDFPIGQEDRKEPEENKADRFIHGDETGPAKKAKSTTASRAQPTCSHRTPSANESGKDKGNPAGGQKTKDTASCTKEATQRPDAPRVIDLQKRKTARERDQLARSRICVIYSIPRGTTTFDICESLAPFRPGAVFHCSTHGSSARFEFFSNAAAEKAVRAIQEKGIELNEKVVRKASVDMAESEHLSTTFRSRVLRFSTPLGSPSGAYCQDPSSLISLLRKHNFHPSTESIQRPDIKDGRPLAISFNSVKDAEKARNIIIEHYKDINVVEHPDRMGSVVPMEHDKEQRLNRGTDWSDIVEVAEGAGNYKLGLLVAVLVLGLAARA